MLMLTLLLVSLVLPSIADINPPPSPCRRTFVYDARRYTENSWQGTITLPPVQSNKETTVDIILDNTVHILANWAGEVTTKNNKRFTVTLRGSVEPQALSFLVRFNSRQPIPRLTGITINGVVICVDKDFTPASSTATISTTTRFPILDNEKQKYTRNVTHLSSPPEIHIGHPSYLEIKDSAGTVRYPLNPAHTQPHFNTQPQPDFKPQPRPQTETQIQPNHQHQPSRVYECGKTAPSATPLSINGQPTQRGQWPWHAAVYSNLDGNLKYKCGGSLVSLRSVITAAHCVTLPRSTNPQRAEHVIVYLGKYRRHQWGEEGVQQKLVERIYVHPLYNYTNFLGDIAVVRLKPAAQYTDYVRPACLGHHDIIAGKNGTVVGWGIDETYPRGEQPDDLRKAELTGINDAQCFENNREFFSKYMNENMFCAGTKKIGPAVCESDIGGGLLVQNGTRWVVRGIVSVTAQIIQKKCDSRYYALFTDVDRYEVWIEKYI